jgi:putative endonuclease
VPHTRQQGSDWETAAESFLQQQGLKSLTRNFYSRLGELDLVMLDGATLVFVEVRYRASSRHGSGAASITRVKQRRIINAAKRFLQCERQYATRPCRFDVVSIGRKDGRTVMNWIRSAFDAG